MHCSGRVAPNGWMACSSALFGRASIAACTSAMRGSVSNVATSGGGDGRFISHCSGAREPGRVASSAWRWVDPVRGRPVTMIGAVTRSSAIAGKRLRSSTRRSRLTSRSTCPDVRRVEPVSRVPGLVLEGPQLGIERRLERQVAEIAEAGGRRRLIHQPLGRELHGDPCSLAPIAIGDAIGPTRSVTAPPRPG